jgi:sugar phosphate isomerase/epimerase
MQIGIFAKTYPEAEPGALAERIAGDGYEAAHFNLACLGLGAMPDAVDMAVLDHAKNAFRAKGLTLAGLSGTYNMIHPDRAIRAQGQRCLDVVAGAARRLGAPVVTLCTGTRHVTDPWADHPDNRTAEAWHDLVVELESAIAIAERHDVVLGLEPELANVVHDAKAARRLLDQFSSKRLRIVLDPANLFETAEATERTRVIEEAIELLAPEIAMAHAKDRKADGRFCAAGQGVVDFAHFMRRLATAGFSGPMITHGLSAGEAPVVARFLEEARAAA